VAACDKVIPQTRLVEIRCVNPEFLATIEFSGVVRRSPEMIDRALEVLPRFISDFSRQIEAIRKATSDSDSPSSD